MIIKIDDSFAENAITNGLADFELLQLSRLYKLMAEKKLFVRVDNSVFLAFLLNNYSDYFDKFARGTIKNVLSNFTSIMSAVSKQDYLFSITKDSIIFADQTNNNCSISITELPDELCPYFYAENDEDAKFYYKVFEEIGPKCPIYIRLRGFGGGSGKSVIKNLIEDRTVFFVVIDSDRNYCNCGVGSTALSIKRLFNHNRLFWEHYILTVREKENLLPIDAIKSEAYINMPIIEFLKSNRSNEVLEYFDVKTGIEEDSFLRKSSDPNWCRIHMPAIEFLEKEKGIVFDDSDKKSIAGVGDSFISRLIVSDGIVFSNILQNCTFNQKDDWDSIFRLIVKYGYCYDLITN